MEGEHDFLENGIACYSRDGGGPVIFWLHGYTMNAGVWEEVWAHLPDFSHLAIDIPGHGRSRSITGERDLPSLAREIGGIAHRHHARYIVGLSFGGILGLQMAIEAGSLFEGLFLNSSPFGGGPVDPWAESKNLELMNYYRQHGSRGLTGIWMASPPDIFAGVRKQPEIFNKLARIIDEHSWEELKDNKFAVLTGYNQLACGLSRISLPVYLFIGEEDMENVKRCGEIIRKSVGHCVRTYIPEAGHLAFLECPQSMSERVREAILAIRKTP
jgi:pimeloyl-ACP methyl ester carboxylesterase